MSNSVTQDESVRMKFPLSLTILRNRYCGCLFLEAEGRGGEGFSVAWRQFSISRQGFCLLDFVEMCENCLCLVCTSSLHWVAQPGHIPVSADHWQMPAETIPQISNRKYDGSCCNTKHHGRHSGPACTAGALRGPHRKSYCERRERETQYLVNYHFKLFSQN